jgi:hypothetical protein
MRALLMTPAALLVGFAVAGCSSDGGGGGSYAYSPSRSGSAAYPSRAPAAYRLPPPARRSTESPVVAPAPRPVRRGG